MKNLFMIILMLLTAVVHGQDSIYTINNWNTAGITQINGVDPNSGAVSGSTTSYATGDGTTSGASLAIAHGYIYYIQQVPNTGNFTVSSIPAYPTATTGTAPTAGTAQLDADINGSTPNQVFFRRMATGPDGYIYVLATEDGTQNVYLGRFLPAADGSASDFENLGTVTLNGAAPGTNFNNGDIAFDGSGNLYVVVNEDVAAGSAILYYASASTISTTTNGVTNLQPKYTIVDESGANFEGLVVGLAVSSTGNFYLAVQGGTNGGVHIINASSGIVIEGPISTANASSIADLATAYFPVSTIFPVNFGAITASISGGALTVNWATLSEKNNARFDIEVSKDGKKFTTIGTVNTKAPGGNSDLTLNYQFTKSLQTPLALGGISVMVLAFALLFFHKKNKILITALMVVGIGAITTSCSKNGNDIDFGKEEKLWVRIAQYDKDSKQPKHTRVIVARQSD